MLYLTSDLHFWHTNIIKYCHRPFSTVEDMNKSLIRNWNSTISPEDTIIVAGDFGYLNQERGTQIVKELHGKKILVLGNHDERAPYMKKMGFDEVYDELCFSYGGMRFRVSHYPYNLPLIEVIKAFFKGYAHKPPSQLRPVKGREDFLIHGHVHNAWGRINLKSKMVNISTDVWNYKPVAITEIISLIKNPQKFKR